MFTMANPYLIAASILSALIGLAHLRGVMLASDRL